VLHLFNAWKKKMVGKRIQTPKRGTQRSVGVLTNAIRRRGKGERRKGGNRFSRQISGPSALKKQGKKKGRRATTTTYYVKEGGKKKKAQLLVFGGCIGAMWRGSTLLVRGAGAKTRRSVGKGKGAQ